ncbi:MAG: hypothetical protein E6I18_06585 [Chloroflexi bacterium]|nr:MAG: hypothetical protein E6I18_06585 [Chloroflexota bacterium]
MRSRPSVVVAAVAAVAILGGLTACGGATATPLRTEPSRPSAIANQTIPATPTRTATPAPTATPLAIGDACLVGRWTLTSLVMTDTASLPGVVLTFKGQVGTLLTLGADGTEVYDLTNSTQLVGSGGGHTVSWQGQGVQRFYFHGEGGQWFESGPGQAATATHVVVDGAARPDFTNVAPPISGTYACSASDLKMTAVDPVAVTQLFKKQAP